MLANVVTAKLSDKDRALYTLVKKVVENSVDTSQADIDAARAAGWSDEALYDAFTKAKTPYLERLKRGEGQTPEDIRYRSFMPLMGDPLPYGMTANRASIEALMTYALQQKLIPERMPLEQAFFDPDRVIQGH